MDEMQDRNAEGVADAPVIAGPDETQGDWVAKPELSGVIAALRTVEDPEIPVNIYDLGLVYRVDVKNAGLVEIEMTLTAPGCPVAGDIVTWVKQAVHAVAGVGKVQVGLVFDPPWDQSRMSEEARLELGFF